MLTTTIDGLWVLQVLAGIEDLATELGIRPYLPRAESASHALAHPVAAELRASGVIDAIGSIDTPILEWLTVIARRDLALILHIQTPDHYGQPRRVMLARYAQWWVAIERSDRLVRISPVGTADSEASAVRLVIDQIQRLCGVCEPARFRPVTLALPTVTAAVVDSGCDGLRRALSGANLDADQLRLLTMATDIDMCAQASMIAVQYGVRSGSPGRSVSMTAAATVVDTPEGRLLYEIAEREGINWMMIAPGSTKAIAAAIIQIVRRLPAADEWYAHRKAV